VIGIIDYGLGNIKAFENIYNKLSIPFFYARTPDELKKATKIILPGIGAFDHAMTLLNESGLRETLDAMVLQQHIPIIGICVGMQMMANSSDEGGLPGLGWIEGHVKKLDFPLLNTDNSLPLPHMGWNNVALQTDDPIFKNLEENPEFYFLHSFYFDCENTTDSIGRTHYGYNFSCIIRHGNIYGIQCHPEKSHQNGILVLKNFAELQSC
jgi:glutamine amidotransferase